MIRRAPIARRTPLKRSAAPKRKKRVSRKPKASRKREKAALDSLFSKYIRARDGGCRMRGFTLQWKEQIEDEDGFVTTEVVRLTECKGPLQCAHLFSRRYFGTRWDPDNAVGLCAAHHYTMTLRPLEWDEVLKAWLGTQYEDLRRRALKDPMPDLTVARLHIEGLMGKGGAA